MNLGTFSFEGVGGKPLVRSSSDNVDLRCQRLQCFLDKSTRKPVYRGGGVTDLRENKRAARPQKQTVGSGL